MAGARTIPFEPPTHQNNEASEEELFNELLQKYQNAICTASQLEGLDIPAADS